MDHVASPRAFRRARTRVRQNLTIVALSATVRALSAWQEIALARAPAACLTKELEHRVPSRRSAHCATSVTDERALFLLEALGCGSRRAVPRQSPEESLAKSGASSGDVKLWHGAFCIFPLFFLVDGSVQRCSSGSRGASARSHACDGKKNLLAIPSCG